VSAERNRVEELAHRVTDGAAIDWDAEERQSTSADERDAVRGLRLLATIAGVRDSLAASKLAPGSLWGSLELVEPIAEGAFGDVWRARDPRLDREVALKLLAGTVSAGRDVLAEGRMLARVRHPNVLSVYGAEEHDGRVGIWTELVRGQTLADRLRDHGPFGPHEAAVVGVDVCRALAAVHAAGLVHGDVKAQNVLREDGGRIVLVDFGTGRMQSADAYAEAVSGTPMYFAPEILAAGAPTASGDLYATGVLLYHLVTRSFPVAAASVDELAAKHRQGERTRLRDARPDLPEAFVHVVERASAPEPAHRYPSAGAMEEALLGAIGQGTTKAKRRRAIIVAGVVAAGMVGSILWWVLGRPAALDAEASLLRVRADGAREAVTPGSAVAPGDRLEFEIATRQAAWVYVLNEDERGHAFVLFPLPGLDLQNPISGKLRHRLPGTERGRTRYWGVNTVGGREHFLVVTSTSRAEAFEAALAALPAPDPQEGAVALDPVARSALLRGVGTLVDGPQDTEGASAARLFALAREMEREGALRGGVEVLEITVLNPGTDAGK